MVAEMKFSKVMNNCNIICALLVAFIHAYNISVYTEVSNSAVYWLEEAISQCFARGAVPFFFMSSAYFLYSKKKTVVEIYKSRFKSIVVPYLLWNTIYMVSFAILYRLSLSNSGMNEINAKNILGGIFLHKYNYVYWFMLYLIVFILLYPIVRWIVSLNKWVAVSGVIILTVVYFCGVSQVEHFIYYYIGAIVGYYYKEAAEKLSVLPKKTCLLITMTLVLLGTSLFFAVNIYALKLELFRNLVMTLLIFFLVVSCNINLPASVLGYSFMIYSMHSIVLEVIEKLIYRLLPHTSVWMLVDYLVAPIACIAVICVLCIAMKKLCPWLYKWLNGGRV